MCEIIFIDHISRAVSEGLGKGEDAFIKVLFLKITVEKYI